MIFKELGARSFTCKGVDFSVDYDGAPSTSTGDFLDKEVMPLILAAPEMAALLQKIIAGDFPGFPTFLDESDRPDSRRILKIIRDEATRLAPRRKK